eukprot:scaffold2624_cov108-Skeletonema_dohrnii-CCMP3373.AAC.3
MIGSLALAIFVIASSSEEKTASWCANTSPFHLLCYDQMMVSAPYHSGQTSDVYGVHNNQIEIISISISAQCNITLD